MHIDRSRFLVLTATIAAGCAASQTGPEEVTVATPVEVEPTSGDEPVDPGDRPDDGTINAGGGPSLSELCQSLEPPPGPHCESFSDTKNDCTALIDGLETDAAERAVNCLASRSKTESICRFDAIQDCFIIGTSASMPEPRLNKECSAVVKNCAGNRWARGDLTMETCGAVMAAVKDHLEADMIGCMAEGCGLGSCVWRLR